MDSHLPPKASGAPGAPREAETIKRPRGVTLLVLGVLIITVINLTRFVLGLRDWSFLASQPGISPLYLVISGFVWTAAGSLLIWSLWKPNNWAPRLLEAEALTYALYYWLDLLFLRDHLLSSAPGAIQIVLPTNWQFSAGITVICLVYIMWTLGRAKVKAYFGQAWQNEMPQ